MNVLGKLLDRITRDVEKNTEELVMSDSYRLNYHLMPPTGWLNDPNGLCWFRGQYHVFFQYSPFDAAGGLKLWGHSTTTDFVHFQKCPVMIYPDEPWNAHGAYSGSALIENDTMYLCYTGNIKSEGHYDYVHTGREQNTVLAISEDGMRVKEQRILLENEDYPKDVTLHVRDPKIIREDDGYYCLLGARNNKDCGEVLVYHSVDLKKWELSNRIATDQPFGYMWECPDLVSFNGQMVMFLSPQGIEHEKYRFQNQYSCGYFPVYGDYRTGCTLGDYHELDYGFDFYAQQTFQAPDGRVLALAWMGMPDADYTNPTAESHHWQHAMTLVRELTWNGTSVQALPAKEYQAFMRECGRSTIERITSADLPECSVLAIENEGKTLVISLENELEFIWDGTEATLTLSGNAGSGRKSRYVKLDHLEDLQIWLDRSSAEIFINHGETVLSTRFYPKKKRAAHVVGSGQMTVYEIAD